MPCQPVVPPFRDGSMNFVITLAGAGKRFKDAGFAIPKPLIRARGKTLLEWSVDSLPLHLCSNLIFVLLKAHENEYRITDMIRKRYGGRRIHFAILPRVSRGQAESVWLAKHKIQKQEPLLIFNSDTHFTSSTLERSLGRNDIDGVLGAFAGESPRFSFAKTNALGWVTEVAEKKPISANALTGLYHFAKADDYLRVAEASLRENLRVKGEFYVAPLYNPLIREGKKFVLDFCDEHHILGTPDELKAFAGITS
jgi:NDP-sugar pyrophosphorylase family protein